MTPTGDRRVRRPPAPGTPEEVMRAPADPSIGVFVDFDGTLIAGYSAAVFGKERLRTRQIGLAEVLRTVRFYVEASAGRVDVAAMLGLTAKAWAGHSVEEMTELSQRLFDQQISRRLYPEMRRLVRAHQQRGHTLVLTSSATSFQIEPMAAMLGVKHVLCTRLATADGVLTGEVEGSPPWGPGKADAVQAFAAEHGIDLSRSYAYADGDEDIALLHLVGAPRAVNPGRRLAGVAARRGWPVLRHTSRGGEGGLLLRARNVLGTAAIVPAAAVGVAVGVVRRDKRAGVELAFPAWVDAMLYINGVRVDAVGVENAWAERPCVFVHNHLTNFDSFLVTKVVRGGVSGVGKKDIGKNPIGALLTWALDATLIDRSDTATAIEAMRPMVDRLASGVSIVIAPEGTRSVTGELGPFKKGAFHVALQAGVPIVPVVLRNADVLGPASATMMRPGVVELAVLPPVSTKGWLAGDIGRHVDEVRQMFVDTLAHWPEASD
jgi:putative phosphoserine phosphatase/1-acylglycerol-3-phosphate O-acyltransferase